VHARSRMSAPLVAVICDSRGFALRILHISEEIYAACDWLVSGLDNLLAQIPKLGESCSSSSSCSICGTSAPKRESDHSSIILFHHSDREICRILGDEQEHEHDFSTSAFRFRSVTTRRFELSLFRFNFGPSPGCDVTFRGSGGASPVGSRSLSANLIVIARRLVVPEGLLRVAWHEVPGMV
jgi:hypothetical protein